MKLDPNQRIALFGTSADPPTIGHKKIIEELSKIYSYIVTYASNNPQKKHQEDIEIRSLLLRTMIEDLNNPKIIFNQNLSSQWAVESVKKCKNIYNLVNLDFIIGSDLISEIFSWKSSKEIIQEVNFLVINRQGYPIKNNTLKMLKTYKVNFEISTINIPNISSSMIRLNTNYSNLPKSILEIVKKNNLYSPEKLVE